MAKIMKITALCTTLITFVCVVFYICMESGPVLSLAISFGTTAYHFVMRLLVGVVFDRLLHNHVNYRLRWFQVSAAEQKLYKKLRVKQWKGKMATYDPGCFDSTLHSWDEIAQAMCQAELVHEVIMILSFIPLLAAIPFGDLWVFVITSVLAACYDAMFVMMQRYNRPRVMKLMETSEKANLKRNCPQ